MVRTYTHLAAVDLLDHADAIRLPSPLLSASTNSSTAAVSEDSRAEENLNVISGVDDGIRTHNNRNHNPQRNVVPNKKQGLTKGKAARRRVKTG